MAWLDLKFVSETPCIFKLNVRDKLSTAEKPSNRFFSNASQNENLNLHKRIENQNIIAHADTSHPQTYFTCRYLAELTEAGTGKDLKKENDEPAGGLVIGWIASFFSVLLVSGRMTRMSR